MGAVYVPAGTSGRGRATVVALSASVVTSVAAGAVAGFVWGGVGGRIVMRVLFLTSDDAVRGLTSDDGFEIGRVSTATIGFVIAMTVVGGVLGSLYGFARHFVDGSTGPARIGIPVAVGLLAGAAIVHTDGVDFRFLDPLWLSVGSFVVLPALWAATLVGLTERALHSARLGPIPAIDERPLGRIGTLFAWTVIATMSIIGLVDLISDYRDLT